MSGMLSMWKGEIPVTPRAVSSTILAQVAYDHEVSVADMLSPARHRAVAYARFDAMSRLRALKTLDGTVRYSTPQIAKLLGLKDHTTVLNGLRRWEIISAERIAKSAGK